MILCKNINKVYKTGGSELRVLKDVSIEIDKGEFLAVIGPSGSGKSTLMHIMGLLDRPTSGEYLLDGKNVSSLSNDELAEIRSEKIGFVFQSFNLLSRASVLRNVMLPLVYDTNMKREEREKRAEEALSAVGLEKERWHHLSNQLSGGQMQRVAIARALVNHPSIILADEPTGNLDSKTGDIVLETFRELNKKHGHTVILITHERDVAKQANRIIEIRDGEIISDESDIPKILKEK